MLTLFKKIFIWWNQDTFGTKLKTIFFGKLVGKDSFGNKCIKPTDCGEGKFNKVTNLPPNGSECQNLQTCGENQYISELGNYLLVPKNETSLICDENRSIVSDIAGTTRDYIDLSIEYKGILITLIDTAGIRDTSNKIETLGIDKIKELSNQVDGYIYVKDITTTSESTLPSFLDTNKPIIHVINKIDKSPNSDKSPNTHYISCTDNITWSKSDATDAIFNQRYK